MVPYQSLNKSGVVAYELIADGIIVEFKNGKQYKYCTDNNDQTVIDEMRKMAESGSGLASFVSRNKPAFTIIESADV